MDDAQKTSNKRPRITTSDEKEEKSQISNSSTEAALKDEENKSVKKTSKSLSDK